MNDVINTSKFLVTARDIRDCFIGHAAVKTALSELEDTHLTGSHAILIGEPGLGKTSTLQKYKDRYLKSVDTTACPSVVSHPILFVCMPSVLTVKNFLEELLRELDSPVLKLRRLPGVSSLTASLITLIRERGITMIMIDEFQNLLSNSRVKASKAILETIKHLMTQTDASIVLTGTPQGWRDLLANDDGSVAQRLAHHINLKPFMMTSEEETERFQRFLKTMARWLADREIDASYLGTKDMAERLFKATGGTPREIASLLRLSLMNAHHEGASMTLNRSHFYAAFPKLHLQACSQSKINPFRD